MKTKFILCVLFCLYFILGYSQNLKDTTIIDAICVYGNQEYFNDGAKREFIDTNLVNNNPGATLNAILQQSSPALIRSYGHNGASSSVSLRGAGASRTQVSWEGFPLNSLTMGGNELSMITASNFNSIAINHSASATYFGSGTFGGAIELKNTPNWKQNKKISFAYTEGSFNTKNVGSQINIGNKNIQYFGSIFYNTSDGNFPYFDSISQENTVRKNANYFGYGTIQNLHVKLTENVYLQVGAWYQVKHMNIPNIIGNNSSMIETQIDSSLKTFVTLKGIFKNSSITYRTAIINDYQLYTKKPANIPIYFTYSVIESFKNLHSIQYRKFHSNKLTSIVELQGNLNSAEVTNYNDKKTEYSTSGMYAIQYKTNKLQSNASIKKELNSQYQIPLIYNIGSQYYLYKNKMILRANFGTKYRTPTFNDLYWEIWGNPDLLPEYGYSFEIGNQYTLLENKNSQIITDINVFNSVIHDMILWNQEGSVWHPINLAEATIQGIEFRLKQLTTLKKCKLKNTFGLDYNNSHISQVYSDSNSEATLGHQLYYVPKYSMLYNSELTIKKFTFSVFTNFLSSRYYSFDDKLKSTITLDGAISYSHKTENITSYFIFQSKNITNTQYELVRSYPMPGRYFEFSIQFYLNN